VRGISPAPELLFNAVWQQEDGEEHNSFSEGCAQDRLDQNLRRSTGIASHCFRSTSTDQTHADSGAKGCSSTQVLYGHIFRNAMLIVIAGFPGAFVHAFFTGALLIETIFSLDGLGLLGFESVLNRDYPVVFATLYIFSLVGIAVNLIADLTYTWVDPRIDFETREV